MAHEEGVRLFFCVLRPHSSFSHHVFKSPSTPYVMWHAPPCQEMVMKGLLRDEHRWQAGKRQPYQRTRGNRQTEMWDHAIHKWGMSWQEDKEVLCEREAGRDVWPIRMVLLIDGLINWLIAWARWEERIRLFNLEMSWCVKYASCTSHCQICAK